MKPITITGSDLIRELLIWIVTLIGAIGVNFYAIMLHDGAWSELYTQFHFVLVISVVFYLFIAIVRGIILGIKVLIKKTQKS